MFEQIKALVAKNADKLPEGGITKDTDLYLDLGWTSLDMVSCIMDLEAVAGREIPDDELNGIHTVGDLCRLLGA